MTCRNKDIVNSFTLNYQQLTSRFHSFSAHDTGRSVSEQFVDSFPHFWRFCLNFPQHLSDSSNRCPRRTTAVFEQHWIDSFCNWNDSVAPSNILESGQILQFFLLYWKIWFILKLSPITFNDTEMSYLSSVFFSESIAFWKFSLSITCFTKKLENWIIFLSEKM